MKKKMKFLGIIALVAIIGLAMIACGGGGGSSPKALAKQNYEAFVTARDGEGSAKEAAMEKVKTLTEKADKLSEADRKVYEEEFMRLMNGK